jgi:hypothetical protein
MDDSPGIKGGLHNPKIAQQPEARPYTSARPTRTEGAGPGFAFGLASVSGPASGSVSAPPPERDPQPAGRKTPQRIPRWLERAELILRVLLRMYIGLAVCYAPWSHIFWDQNPLFAQFPAISIFAANGAVRGMVSGLGLLNLWIALQDAIHHGDK